MPEYYKVLQVYAEDTFISATGMGHIVKYKIGEPATPRPTDGPLCIFDNIADARRFAYDLKYGYFCIFGCSAILSPDQKRGVWFLDNCGGEHIILRSTNLPEGTVLADEVTLIERIQDA